MTLAGQLGCGKTIDIGCAAVKGERGPEYAWVASKMDHFVRPLLDRSGHVNISDRDKGISYFTKQFSCLSVKCCQHIDRNIYQQKSVMMPVYVVVEYIVLVGFDDIVLYIVVGHYSIR